MTEEDFNKNPTAKTWIEIFRPVIEAICDKYFIAFEDIERLADNRSYEEFSNAFGKFVADAIHNQESAKLN